MFINILIRSAYEITMRVCVRVYMYFALGHWTNQVMSHGAGKVGSMLSKCSNPLQLNLCFPHLHFRQPLHAIVHLHSLFIHFTV